MNGIREFLRRLWHNLRVLWRKVRYPLTDEQKAADMDDLIDPPQDEQAEAPE